MMGMTNREMFQALIGTVRTSLRAREVSTVSLFQALIGTVRTAGVEPGHRRPASVSSPHRYCQNRRHPHRDLPGCRVSSPHRYCQNPRGGVRMILRFDGFQALIGTVRTGERVVDPDDLTVVSSPHRYCQNPLNAFGLSGEHATFQALIGTVRTSLAVPSRRGRVRFQALIGTVRTRHLDDDRAPIHRFKPS